MGRFLQHVCASVSMTLTTPDKREGAVKIVLYDDYNVGLVKDGNVVDVSSVVPNGGVTARGRQHPPAQSRAGGGHRPHGLPGQHGRRTRPLE
jgi:hypothetical protein